MLQTVFVGVKRGKFSKRGIEGKGDVRTYIKDSPLTDYDSLSALWNALIDEAKRKGEESSFITPKHISDVLDLYDGSMDVYVGVLPSGRKLILCDPNIMNCVMNMDARGKFD